MKLGRPIAQQERGQRVAPPPPLSGRFSPESKESLSDDQMDLSPKQLRFFAVVVAVASITLLAQAISDYVTLHTLNRFIPVLVIYPIIGMVWRCARRFSWPGFALLQFILLAATGSVVHHTGGVLSASSAYYVFLAVAIGLLVLAPRIGLWLSLSYGLAYLVQAVLELGRIAPVSNSAYSQLYQESLNIPAVGQVAAVTVVILFASALSRLVARAMRRDSLEKAALYAAAERGRMEWEATFAAITDGISVHDESLRIVRANPALSKMLGLKARQLLGQQGEDVFAEWYGSPSPLALSLKHNQLQIVQVDEPGGRPGNFRVTTYPLNHDNGRAMGVVQIIQDITVEKQVQAQLVQAEKVAALGRMVASLAHEINNPLQALNSGVRLLLKPSLTEEKRERYLTVAAAEIERLVDISERMLSFSFPPAATATLTDVNGLVEDVLKLDTRTL